MEFKPSKGFMDDIIRLADLCAENETDGIEIAFNVGNRGKAIVDMTFRAEGSADGELEDHAE